MRLDKKFIGNITLPVKTKDWFWWAMQPYLKLAQEHRLWLVSPHHHKGLTKVFREYAEWRYGNKVSSAAQMIEAAERLNKAVEDATATAEKLQDAYRRYWATQRARHWRPRSWKRKGW